MKSENYKPGDQAKVIDDSGIPDYIKNQGFKNGSILTIREIAEKDFNNDGGGLRFKGITTFSDLTGFEKAFSRKRVQKVKSKIKSYGIK